MEGPALRFGRYEAVFRIGAGGMAEVFAARIRGEAGFERLVALKRILPHRARDRSVLDMFLDEARIGARMGGPHVVQTLDLGRADDGAPYLVMELVVGPTLAELVGMARRQHQHVPLREALEMIAQAADGLHAAHEAKTPVGEPLGLVHRDVSPQNILLGDDGRVRLSDFGIAWVKQERLTRTEDGGIKGKYAYLSPEQSHGEALDRRSDVFSLGIVAWEVLAGRRLFGGRHPADAVIAVRSAPIPPLPAVRSDVPEAVQRILALALVRDVEDRLASAGQMANELRRAARELGDPMTAADLAALGASLRPERVLQLEDRIRRAVATPASETLPDIDAEEVTVYEDESATWVSEGAAAEVVAIPPTVVTPPRQARALRTGWIAAGVALVVLSGIGLVLGLAGEEAPPPSPTTPLAVTGAASPPVPAPVVEIAPAPVAAPEPATDPTPAETPPIVEARPVGRRSPGRGGSAAAKARTRVEAPPATPSGARLLRLDAFDDAVQPSR